MKNIVKIIGVFLFIAASAMVIQSFTTTNEKCKCASCKCKNCDCDDKCCTGEGCNSNCCGAEGKSCESKKSCATSCSDHSDAAKKSCKTDSVSVKK